MPPQAASAATEEAAAEGESHDPLEMESAVTTAAPGEMLSAFASRTLVIIPAFNEEECVGDVVRRLRERGFRQLRVVDNASTDRTAETARAAGAKVIRTEERGYGLACWEGSQHLTEGIEWLLYCNADASDDFEAYGTFARLAADNDLLLGCRTHPEDQAHMTPPQRFGNWLAPALIRLLWGRRFADLGPQRALRADAFRRLNLQDRGFGWTVEMQVRAVEEGLRIAEIPVRTFPRPAGKQKISGTLRGSLAAGCVILQTIAHLAARGAWRTGRPTCRAARPAPCP